MIGAEVLLDSVSPAGYRLTTLQVTMHRFVLAEFNTHRVFSRNSASSRAIPINKQLIRVDRMPADPAVWAAEQPGMQGGAELTGRDQRDAEALFQSVREITISAIANYLQAHPDPATRLHKSLLNRLLEPFMWHTVIVSSTEWTNFYGLRCSPLAQPEMRLVAEAIRDAIQGSNPTELQSGQWHTPLIQPDEVDLDRVTRARVSAARVARVSYLTHDGRRDIGADLELFNRLANPGDSPPHASPLEHVATPCRRGLPHQHRGNFHGWDQLRHWTGYFQCDQ